MLSHRNRFTGHVLGTLLLAFALLTGDLEAWSPSRGEVPPPPSGPSSVHSLMQYTAANVATFLRNYEKESVAIEVRVPPAMKGAGSNVLLQLLSEQLAERKIKVVPKADFTLLVECKRTSGDRLGVAVTMQIIDSLGEVVHDRIMRADLFGETRLFGITGRPKKGGDFAIEAIKKPQAFIEGSTQARASRDAKLGVEVVVGKAARELTRTEGLCYASLELKEEYQIRVVNDSAEEVLARVLVDGLSVFHFSELRATDEARKGRPRYRFYVVPPGGTVTVQGWHKRVAKDGKTIVEGFKITPPEESAAGKLGKADMVGVISVEFLDTRRVVEKEKLDPLKMTYYEVIPRQISTRDRNGRTHRLLEFEVVAREMMQTGTRVGTGFGTEKIVDLKEVQRWIGPLREVVSIHYRHPE